MDKCFNPAAASPSEFVACASVPESKCKLCVHACVLLCVSKDEGKRRVKCVCVCGGVGVRWGVGTDEHV